MVRVLPTVHTTQTRSC